MIKETKELLKQIDYCSKVPEFHMNSCCQQHDLDYENKIGKFKADWEFFKCGWTHSHIYYPDNDTLASSTKALGKRVFARSVATTYYIGVTLFGWIPYFKSRKKNVKEI